MDEKSRPKNIYVYVIANRHQNSILVIDVFLLLQTIILFPFARYFQHLDPTELPFNFSQERLRPYRDKAVAGHDRQAEAGRRGLAPAEAKQGLRREKKYC